MEEETPEQIEEINRYIIERVIPSNYEFGLSIGVGPLVHAYVFVSMAKVLSEMNVPTDVLTQIIADVLEKPDTQSSEDEDMAIIPTGSVVSFLHRVANNE